MSQETVSKLNWFYRTVAMFIFNAGKTVVL